MEDRVTCFSLLALFDIRQEWGRNILGCLGINKEEDSETGKSSESYRPWQDLNHAILIQIFKRNSLDSLLWSVPFVCRSWRCALWDALFWDKKYLDLFDLFLHCKKMGWPIQYPYLEIKLMDTIRSIFEGDAAHQTPPEGWSQSLISITLPFGFYISDRILLYIAKRTPNLSSFLLGRSDKLTEESICKVIACWKDITLLELGPVYCGRRTSLLQHISENWTEHRRVKIHPKSFEFQF